MMKAAIVALNILIAFAAAPCFAHAKLESSTPAANAQLNAAPTTLSLKFSEPATLAVLKLLIGGKEIPIPVDKNAKPDRAFSFSLPALAPGQYTVQWSALAADDGHVTKGSFAFTIAG